MFKKLTVLLLALFVLGGSFVAYSYWDTLNKTESEIVIVGQGVTLQVAAVATAPAGKVLVPSGVVLKANDVTSIVLTYHVKLDLEVVSALALTVTADDILINSDGTYAGLVNIEIVKGEATVNNTDVLVTVTVTLTEPANETAYNAIINQPISFNLNFTVAP